MELDPKQLRDQGIAAARAGDKAKAYELLRQSTLIDDSDPDAWLWLAYTSDNRAQQVRAVRRSAELDPISGKALKMAQQLGINPADLRPQQHAPAPPQPQPPTVAAQPAPKKGGGCIGTVFLLSILLLGATYVYVEFGSGLPAQDPNDRAGAVVACQNAVLDQLKAPSTAEFSSRSETTADRVGSRWDVAGWVDAQNSFGATVRTVWGCTATYNGGWSASATLVE